MGCRNDGGTSGEGFAWMEIAGGGGDGLTEGLQSEKVPIGMAAITLFFLLKTRKYPQETSQPCA